MRQFKKRQLRLLSRMALMGHFLRAKRAQRLGRLQRKHLLRLEGALAALLIVSSVLLQTYFTLRPPSYSLDPRYQPLVGDSRDDTAKYLAKNKQGTAFDFVVPANTDTEAKEHTGRVDDAYSANLSIYAREGISVTDTASKIAVTMTPQFSVGPGQKVDGDHIVYSLGSTKLVYTLKYNGLKEDIILPEAPKSGQSSYKFTLSLPAGVEARLDDQGNIGIYSADPTLFGNISFGSDQDREKVDKARENSSKTHLVMTIPSPVVKDSTGKEYSDRVNFQLGAKQTKQIKQADKNLPPDAPKSLTTINSYDLTIAAKDLKDLSYPISIDPTMTVTSAGDFTNVNQESGTDIDANNNLIKRSGLSGGSTGSWANNGTGMTAFAGGGAVIVNGFIYTLGGCALGNCDKTVQFAPISSSGSIGAWSTSIAQLTTARGGSTAVTYNGYIYVLGGATQSTTGTLNTGEYAKIKSDGTLVKPSTGAAGWDSLSNTGFATNFVFHSSFVANGYAYVIGGCSNIANCNGLNPGVYLTTSYYAKINADGSLASDSDGAGACTNTWCATGLTLSAGLHQSSAAYYNGFVYLTGGETSSGSVTTVQYAKVNSNGTLSGTASNGWLQTTSLTTAVRWHSAVATNGYLYVLGGLIAGGQTAATYYAQINADGSIGTGTTSTTWRSMSNLTNTRQASAALAYAGYIYAVGGNNGGGNLTTTDRAQISSAGELLNSAWCTNTTSPCGATSYVGAARYASATVVSNNYIYLIGGCYNNVFNCATNSVVDYVAINADGSLGTWQSSNATGLGNMAYLSAVAYDGYLYVIAGCTSGANNQCGGGTASTFSSAINASTGAPGNWSAEANLPANFAQEAAFRFGNKLYFTGGCTPNDFSSQSSQCLSPKISNKTYVATMNNSAAAGSRLAGGFTDTGRDLPIVMAAHGVATYGNFVYVAGGWTGSARTNKVYFSSLDAAGNLQAWLPAGNDLPIAVMGHSLVASNGYLYSYGGCTSVAGNPYDNCSGGAVTTVNVAKISNSGSIDNWQATQSMPAARDRFGGVAFGGVLYAVGGTNAGNSSTYLTTSTYQFINNGGSGQIKGWTQDAQSFTTARQYHDSIAYNGYLYVIGGSGALTLQQNIRYTAINADGSLVGWNNTATAAPVSGAQWAEAYNGYMYIVEDDKGSFYAPIQPNGDITTSWTTGPSVPASTSKIAHTETVRNGNTIYVVGGHETNPANVSDGVFYININANGSLPGSWQVATSLPAPRAREGLSVAAGYLYVVAGCLNCNGQAGSTSVLSAPINANGSLGTWTEVSQTPIELSYGETVVWNGYMYYLAPYSQSYTGAANVEQSYFYAPIAPGGQLGAWQKGTNDASQKMGDAREIGSSALWNGVVYVTGGKDGNALSNTVVRAPLRSIPRTGSFSKMYDFDVGVKPTKLITRGTKQTGAVVGLSYMNNNNTSSSYGSATSSSDIAYGGSSALSIALGNNVTLSRYFFVYYTIDDTYSAVFPDGGNESTITDFDLYYTSNPGRRLRNGRTFTTGNDGKPTDRGLQANPQ